MAKTTEKDGVVKEVMPKESTPSTKMENTFLVVNTCTFTN